MTLLELGSVALPDATFKGKKFEGIVAVPIFVFSYLLVRISINVYDNEGM